MNNIKLIEAKTVGVGGVAYIEFTDIPQTYTDLHIYLSVRASTNAELYATVNNSNSGYTNRQIQGNGATVSGGTYQTSRYFLGEANWSSFTSNTFSSQHLYFSNYTSSLNKSLSTESITENDATTTYSYLIGGIWSGSSAISSIKFTISSGTFDQHSTAYLYGVSNTTAGTNGAKAYGGYVTEDSNYFYHTFLSSGIFTPTQSLTADVLVIAGGGGSQNDKGGGGGAGGVSYLTGASLTTTSYVCTVGGGGGGNANGNNSVWNSSVTSNGGGKGGTDNGGGRNGSAGGSGGGASRNGTVGSANQGNTGGATGYGSNGGAGSEGTPTNNFSGGGGGGAGQVGQVPTGSTGGVGGNGLNTWSSWAYATNTGDQGYYAGGGGGQPYIATGSAFGAAGGLGGGGTGGNWYASNNQYGSGVSGFVGTGGGAGGGGASGGSGLIIVRYAK